MSGIVLSAATRQSLLAAKDTAELLGMTQNRLATGKKVNSALDNPTSFFTAAGLDARATDISNLLDSISNGVQAIQAANTGITSIQKLVDSAKSVANQALQTTVGYSAKSSIAATAITGATASNLLGNATSASVDGTAVTTAKARTAYTAATVTAASAVNNDNTGTAAAITTSTKLTGTAGSSSDALSSKITTSDTLTVNGKTITFAAGSAPAAGAVAAGSGVSGNLVTDGAGNSTVYIGDTTTGTGTVGDVLNAIDIAIGNKSVAISSGAATLSTASGATAASITGGKVSVSTGTAQALDLAGSALAKIGLTAATTALGGGTLTTNGTLAGTTQLGSTTPGSGTSLGTAFAANDTVTVNGKTLTFKASGAAGANEINVTDDVSTLLSKIDGLSGGSGSSVTAGKITLNTGTASDLAITSSNTAALGALGLPTAGVSQARSTALSGLTLNIASTGGGTATAITFGKSAGQVSTLAELNTALSANNLQAIVDSAGAISITTTNEAASSTVGAVTGTATASGKAFAGLTATGPVADNSAQATRTSLVTQYNNILDQIKTTAQDSGFNGVNLLNGDTLKLTFNETGKSTLNIQGVSADFGGLGLSKLTADNFKDNAATNKVVGTLNNASTTLRSHASTFGSNLSIVQNRQEFSKNLINVLQTGSSNLTTADLNEEAANSQALATRQSLAISALSLANTAQQNVLQLLR
ncbi:MAG: flagellin [Enterovirga sp.]|nr:flagellin [Enterovirga sp.]